MQAFHFFATSAAEWRVDTDIRAITRVMDKSGFEYGVWFVPADIKADYEISQFRPVVEGAVFLGKYQPE